VEISRVSVRENFWEDDIGADVLKEGKSIEGQHISPTVCSDNSQAVCKVTSRAL
jgi:hypothetical protein